jgi:hypothetical protein
MEEEAANVFASFFFFFFFNTYKVQTIRKKKVLCFSFKSLSCPARRNSVTEREELKRASDQTGDLTVNEPNRNGRLSRSNLILSIRPRTNPLTHTHTHTPKRRKKQLTKGFLLPKK